jgi:hypothetical protein
VQHHQNMNLITLLCCSAVVALCMWGRRTPEARGALTTLVLAGGLLLFFVGLLLSALFFSIGPGLASFGFVAMITGLVAVVIGIPAMHFGAKSD